MSLKTRISVALQPAAEAFRALPPGWQRAIGVGVPCGLFVVGVALIMPGHQGALGTATGSGYVGQVLVNGDERDNTVDSLTAAVTRLVRDSAERDRAIHELQEEMRNRRSGNGEPPPVRPAPAAVAPVVVAPEKRGDAVESPAATSQGASTGTARPAVAVPPPAGSGVRTDVGFLAPVAPVPAGPEIAAALVPAAVWSGPPRRAVTEAVRPGSASPGVVQSMAPARRLYVYAPAVTPAAAAVPLTGTPRFFELPPGASFGGVLLTGLDAPTAQQARRDPIPALLRIKHTTILPNSFDADQRECFVLLSGYGDLSAERAYLRTEELSCVLADGSTFVERIEGYVVDETGRVGVRGAVVSKQGAFIARSLVVGIMQGIAQAFSQSNQSFGLGVNQSGQLGLQQYQNMTQSGVMMGFGRGLDRIAEFYLNQAAAMFPVIEVNAGRQVDVVLTKPVKVRLPDQP